MLKNISNLKGTKVLSKNTQKVLGGRKPRPSHPCGEIGGMPISWPQDRCFGWGVIWYNNKCYACY